MQDPDSIPSRVSSARNKCTSLTTVDSQTSRIATTTLLHAHHCSVGQTPGPIIACTRAIILYHANTISQGHAKISSLKHQSISEKIEAAGTRWRELACITTPPVEAGAVSSPGFQSGRCLRPGSLQLRTDPRLRIRRRRLGTTQDPRWTAADRPQMAQEPS